MLENIRNGVQFTRMRNFTTGANRNYSAISVTAKVTEKGERYPNATRAHAH